MTVLFYMSFNSLEIKGEKTPFSCFDGQLNVAVWKSILYRNINFGAKVFKNNDQSIFTFQTKLKLMFITGMFLLSAELSKIDFNLDLQKLRPMECCTKT